VSDPKDKNALLTAAECAERIGLTVRGLRLYEQRGLIAPRRTAKGWRLYGTSEISRLHEILALKRLGLSLSQIAELLEGRVVDLDRTLAMQQSALLKLRERVEQGLALVKAARTKLSTGASLTIDELITLTKEANMSQSSYDITWQRRWEQSRPRKAIQISTDLLDRYTGNYKFEFGHIMTITREGDQLFEQIIGQDAFEIFPESDRVFFLKIVAAQISFVVDQDGAVNTLVLHQDGYEKAWTRVGESEAKRVMDEWRARITGDKPFQNSEATLIRVIAEHQQGTINYSQMIEPLAEAAREVGPKIKQLLASIGPLQNIRFKGVEREWDVYEVNFANGGIQWKISMQPDGKVAGLDIKPLS
jgi:DNA-binding transcriptional MerR regulator